MTWKRLSAMPGIVLFAAALSLFEARAQGNIIPFPGVDLSQPDAWVGHCHCPWVLAKDVGWRAYPGKGNRYVKVFPNQPYCLQGRTACENLCGEELEESSTESRFDLGRRAMKEALKYQCTKNPGIVRRVRILHDLGLEVRNGWIHWVPACRPLPETNDPHPDEVMEILRESAPHLTITGFAIILLRGAANAISRLACPVFLIGTDPGTSCMFYGPGEIRCEDIYADPGT